MHGHPTSLLSSRDACYLLWKNILSTSSCVILKRHLCQHVQGFTYFITKFHSNRKPRRFISDVPSAEYSPTGFVLLNSLMANRYHCAFLGFSKYDNITHQHCPRPSNSQCSVSNFNPLRIYNEVCQSRLHCCLYADFTEL